MASQTRRAREPAHSLLRSSSPTMPCANMPARPSINENIGLAQILRRAPRRCRRSRCRSRVGDRPSRAGLHRYRPLLRTRRRRSEARHSRSAPRPRPTTSPSSPASANKPAKPRTPTPSKRSLSSNSASATSPTRRSTPTKRVLNWPCCSSPIRARPTPQRLRHSGTARIPRGRRPARRQKQCRAEERARQLAE